MSVSNQIPAFAGMTRKIIILFLIDAGVIAVNAAIVSAYRIPAVGGISEGRTTRVVFGS